MKNVLLIILLVMVWSCNNDDDAAPDPIFCTEEARPGIQVTVKDVADDSFLTEEVTVTVTDREYKETLQNFTSNTFFGAYEREGTYTVMVTKKGYTTFTSDPVVVESDICHVITQVVEVLLEKE